MRALDRFAEQVAGRRRGVAWSLIIGTRGKEEACFAFRRVNYGRRGSVARRAERKHDLSLRVARDPGHEREASGRDGTKDRRARRHAVGGTDRADFSVYEGRKELGNERGGRGLPFRDV